MSITFDQDGTAECLYTEAIDLRSIGRLSIARKSLVEFSEYRQAWEVKLPDDLNTVLFQSDSRDACLNWERENLG